MDLDYAAFTCNGDVSICAKYARGDVKNIQTKLVHIFLQLDILVVPLLILY